MHRFFAMREDENKAWLSPEEAAHALRVLRLQKGDGCQALVDGALYAAKIGETAPRVMLQLEEELPSPEPSVRLTLYQGLAKGDKMDYIAQKCTEAGVSRIVPVLFSRCVAGWEKRDEEKKLPRFRRIAAEAAKQAGRAILPAVEAPMTVSQVCQALPGHALALVPWEEQRGRGIAGQLSGQKDIAVIIGPEGGISPEEIASLQASGAVPVTLGPRIFRTETAGLAALIAILTLTGDLS